MTATLLVVLLLGAAQVWVRLQVRAVGYQVQRTTALIETLDHEHSELRAQAQGEKSPELLRSGASKRGFIVPERGQVVILYAPEP